MKGQQAYYQSFLPLMQIPYEAKEDTMRYTLVLILFWAFSGSAFSAEMEDYVDDGKLKQSLTLHHLQLGGFAGRLETKIAIGKGNTWTASFGVGARANEMQGQLTADQLSSLTAALAENDLATLPKVIGADKAVKSPKQIADGASTTITLTYGEKTITANVADGIERDDGTRKLLTRLRNIENAMRKVTLNAAQR